jgi:sugar phosphate isomerase/epimerase
VTPTIGYVASDMDGAPPSAIVELLAASGYTAVDWTMEQYEPLRDEPQRLAQLVTLAQRAGLVVPQLLVHQDYVTLDPELWERRVRRSERAVRACADAGIDTVGVLSGPNRWEPRALRIAVDIQEPRAWELVYRALERVLEQAEHVCIRVALEPCWGTLAHGRYRAEHLLAAVARPPLAVNFDPSHHVLCGDDIPAAIRRWGARIAHVHLKDAFGKCGPGAAARAVQDEDFTFLLPGAGAVPWPELFDALDAIGYTGAMSVQNDARRLLRGPLRGDLPRCAALARELVAGLLDEPPPPGPGWASGASGAAE